MNAMDLAMYRYNLGMAYAAALSSSHTTQNGAVVESFPRGMFDESVYLGWNTCLLSDYEPVKDTRCHMHAEAFAIFRCLQSRDTPRTLYAVWAACHDCAKIIAASGIQRVVRCARASRRSHPSWQESLDIGDRILHRHRVEIIEVDPPATVEPILFRGEKWHPYSENNLVTP
jgi:deoxycytidylate deaminase